MAAHNMKPLTKREKVLLYILAVAAIVAGMYMLLIRPAMERADELDAAILERQMELDDIKSALMTQRALRDEVDENLAGIAEERKGFLPVMTNNELDEYITGLLQTHGLIAISLSIVPGSDEQTPADEIQRYQVETTARGAMPQFMLLLDTVRELDGVRIVTIANEQDETTTPKPTIPPRVAADAKTTPAPQTAPPETILPEGTYTMEIVFSVLEYVDGASTSVALDREE